MTVTGQIKILNRKIKQNKAQYNLDRKAAKISALSFNNSDIYEYLTGEDLGLKPSTVEQAKFEYSPQRKIFNKGLSKDDKKGLFKRLENIKGKNEEQLKAIEDQGKKQLEEIKNIKTDSKSFKMICRFITINKKSRELINKIIEIETQLKTEKLVCTKTDGITQYDFRNFILPFKFTFKIYRRNLTLQEAKDNEQKLSILRNKLNNYYNPRKQEKIEEKANAIKSAKK